MVSWYVIHFHEDQDKLLSWVQLDSQEQLFLCKLCLQEVVPQDLAAPLSSFTPEKVYSLQVQGLYSATPFSHSPVDLKFPFHNHCIPDCHWLSHAWLSFLNSSAAGPRPAGPSHINLKMRSPDTLLKFLVCLWPTLPGDVRNIKFSQENQSSSNSMKEI